MERPRRIFQRGTAALLRGSPLFDPDHRALRRRHHSPGHRRGPLTQQSLQRDGPVGPRVHGLLLLPPLPVAARPRFLDAGSSADGRRRAPVRSRLRVQPDLGVHPRQSGQFPPCLRRLLRGPVRGWLRPHPFLYRRHLHGILGDARCHLRIRRSLSIVERTMRPETKIVLPVFAAVPLVMLAATVGCTWAIAHGAAMAWRSALHFFCHGIPSRCLTLWNVPMPICARCVAIYTGLFTGLISFFALPALHERVMRMVLYAAATPLAIDGI